MPSPKKPVKDYTGRGRKKTQFLSPPKRNYATDNDQYWVPDQSVPTKARKAKKTVKATIRRKRG